MEGVDARFAVEPMPPDRPSGSRVGNGNMKVPILAIPSQYMGEVCNAHGESRRKKKSSK